MSVKIYENGSWRDINTLKRYENGWKSCGFAKKYENGQWVDVWINDKGTWGSITSDLPFDMYSGTAVVHNNTIHLIGREGSANHDAHYYWNGSSWISGKRTEYIAPGRSSAIVYNNLLYRFCDNSAVYTLDGNESSWVQDINNYPPYPFANTATVVYNNELHVMSGSYSEYKTCHYAWNGSSWREVSTLPCSFSGEIPVVYKNEIHVCSRDNHYAWNGSSWREVSTIPINTVSPSLCVWKGKIHLMYASDHYTFDGSTWEYVGATPYDVYESSCLVWNDSIVILGGRYNNRKRDRSSFSVV